MPAEKIENQARWLLYQGNQLLLEKQGEEYQLPVFLESPVCMGKVNSVHKIGSYYDYICYAAELNNPIEERPTSYVWMPLRSAIELIPYSWFGVAARAYQILNWDKNTRYCGRCGQKTTSKANTFERQCAACKLFFYPRISPAIIVMVKKENEILLARQAQFRAGIHSLIAGFVEAGETIEEAVHREVKEEVGINIKNLQYIESQAWPFPDSLMFAFTAEYADGEIELRDGELESAGWYGVNNLPSLSNSSVSVAKKLINHFLAEANFKE